MNERLTYSIKTKKEKFMERDNEILRDTDINKIKKHLKTDGQ